MEFIIDSPKYGKHTVLIDDEDWDKIKEYKWNIHYMKSTGKYYARTHSFKGHKIKEIQLQRLLINAPFDKEVDHKDNNPKNNKKENLRLCSRSENQMNRGKNKNNTSGYKGVFWHKHIKKWNATITVNYKKIQLGYFKTKIEAAEAYNQAALKYHNNFAKLNEVSMCM